NIFAAGLLELDNGRLGEWAFSIDTVQIDIVSNSLVDGSLLGQIHVPIMDEENSLNYSALMAKSDDGVDLLFTINTEEDVSVSMWAAELSLASTSVIAIEKTNDGFTPYAELYGDVTLDIEIQEGNSFEVEAMAFEGLKINHPDENQRIAIDAFSLFGGGSGFDDDDSSEESEEEEQESLSGFPVSISNVAFEEGDGDQAGIGFDLNINLTGDDLGVAGTASIIVTGAYDASGAPFNAWEFDGVELSKVEVEADVPGASFYGSIEIYDGDETYGEGFKGLLGAEFTGVGQLDALAQFGKVDGYRYFFVDAYMLTSAPVIDVLGIGLYGFGGGVFYHMSRDSTDPAMNLEAGTLYQEPDVLGVSLSGITYTPDESTLIGLKAGMTLGIAPGTTFSADADFEMTFGLSNSVPSIRSIGFGGDAYFMAPGSILQREDSQVIGTFDANLDLSDIDDPVFTATAQITFDTEVVTGSGSAAMKLSDDESYIWIGTPDNRVDVEVADIATFGIYACMGDKVPDMPSPSDVISNYNGDDPEETTGYTANSHVMFGGMFSVPQKDYNVGSFYAKADFTLGFDAYLAQVTSDCSYSTGTIGLDGWYLQAQAYAAASADIGLKVKVWFYSGKVSILSFDGYMLMQSQLPNPTWVKGELYAKYSVLSGAVKGSVDYEFEVGDKCTFTTVPEDPISGIFAIGDIYPDNSASDISVLAQPTIAMNFPLDETMSFTVLDDNGDTEELYYRPTLVSFTLEGGDEDPNYTLVEGEDGEEVHLQMIEMMDEKSWYTATATVKWQTRENNKGSWEDVDDAVEVKTVRFKTGDKPNEITADFVEFTWPLENTKNAFYVETLEMYAQTESWDYLLDDPDYDYYFKLTNITEDEVNGYYSMYFKTQNGYSVAYTNAKTTLLNAMASNKGDIWSVEIIGKPEGESPFDDDWQSTNTSTTTTTNDEGVEVSNTEITSSLSGDLSIYTYYFRNSDYTAMVDKIEDLRVHIEIQSKSTGIYEKPYVANGSDYLWLNGHVKEHGDNTAYLTVGGGYNSEEMFDKYEAYGFTSPNGYLDIPPIIELAYIDKEDWENSDSDLIQDYYTSWKSLKDLGEYFQRVTDTGSSSYVGKMDDYYPKMFSDYPRFNIEGKENMYIYWDSWNATSDLTLQTSDISKGTTNKSRGAMPVIYDNTEQILNNIESSMYYIYWKVKGKYYTDLIQGDISLDGSLTGATYQLYLDGNTSSTMTFTLEK
ncbi:MAG: hypothetical protein ABJE80_12510, partial [Reichenbachiella sp.]